MVQPLARPGGAGGGARDAAVEAGEVGGAGARAKPPPLGPSRDGSAGGVSSSSSEERLGGGGGGGAPPDLRYEVWNWRHLRRPSGLTCISEAVRPEPPSSAFISGVRPSNWPVEWLKPTCAVRDTDIGALIPASPSVFFFFLPPRIGVAFMRLMMLAAEVMVIDECV